MLVGSQILFWVVVSVSAILMTVGTSYNALILVGIGSETIQDYYGIASSKYYSFLLAFTIPNLVFPLFAGFMIDLSLDLKWSTILFTFTFLWGQLVWLFAGNYSVFSFNVALIGFFIMGVGGGSLMTAEYTIGAYWFAGKWLTTILSMMIISREVALFFSFTISAELSRYFSNPVLTILSGTIVLLLFTLSSSICQFCCMKFCKEKMATPRETSIPRLFQAISMTILAIHAFLFMTSFTIWFELVLDDDLTPSIYGATMIYVWVTSIVIGIAVDRIGFHLIWILVGCILYLLSLLFWFSQFNYSFTVFTIGIGSAMALCPTISVTTFLFQREYWGRAFSLFILMFNLSKAFTTTLIFAGLSDERRLGVALGACVLSTLLILLQNVIDVRNGNILNKNASFWRDVLWNY